MVELVYTPVLGTGSRKGLEVRVLFWAQRKKYMEKITIQKEDAGKRIDKFLAEEFFLYSRGEIIRKIKKGEVGVNSKNIKPSYMLEEGDSVMLENFSQSGSEKKLVANEKIPLEILFKDENIIVVNKQAGLQVHPSANEKMNTLSNALVAHFPEIAGVHDDSQGAQLRPGIVHRLDKDTSGVMVIARNQMAFAELKKLFASHQVEKNYVALCEGIFEKKEGVIEKPLARSTSYHKQVIARQNTKTIVREAVTRYKVLEERSGYSLVGAFPKTGRMHQIRIHLASVGHPVVGDAVYALKGKNAEKSAPRQLLHAQELKFSLFGQPYDFIAPIPADFEKFLADIRA